MAGRTAEQSAIVIQRVPSTASLIYEVVRDIVRARRYRALASRRTLDCARRRRRAICSRVARYHEPPVGLRAHGRVGGSGALAAMTMATMPTIQAQIMFMVLFGIGSTIGMAACRDLPAFRLRGLRCARAFAWTSAAAGVISLVAGIFGWQQRRVRTRQRRARVGPCHRRDGRTLAWRRRGAGPRRRASDSPSPPTAVRRITPSTLVPPGDYDVTFTLINFAQQTRRGVRVSAGSVRLARHGSAADVDG